MHDGAIIDGSAAWPADAPGPVVTIGNFDGVHRGHRTLLDRTRGLADALGTLAVAFTFHPAPRDVLRPGNPVLRLQRLEDRVASLIDAGMDHVVVEPFSKAYAAHDATWFAHEVLGRRLRARGLVVGWDFRFGKGRSGGIDTLRRELDVPVEQLPALQDTEEPVSSSRIRVALTEGRVAEAATLLGRPHQVVGPVVPGDARGRKLGFPTANVDAETALVPADGVYAVTADLGDGVLHPGVANVGVRPTFGQEGARKVEVHLLDFSGDLYSRIVRVGFVKRLRDELRFDSLDALIQAIHNDIADARAILGAPE